MVHGFLVRGLAVPDSRPTRAAYSRCVSRHSQSSVFFDRTMIAAMRPSSKICCHGVSWRRAQAFEFLVFVGLIQLPRLCTYGGHAWQASTTGGYPCVHCTQRLDGEGGQRCNSRMTWRLPGTLAHNLPSNVKPVQLVKGIYWYIQVESCVSTRPSSRRRSVRRVGFRAGTRRGAPRGGGARGPGGASGPGCPAQSASASAAALRS